MNSLLSFIKRNMAAQIAALILVFLVAFTVVSATTTISTDVVTDGNLQASTTLLVTGNVFTYADALFGNAATDIYKFTGQLHSSSTSLFTEGLTTYGDSRFGDTTADITRFTGQLFASTTALFTNGLKAFTSITLQNDETIGNATDGNVFLAATTFSVATTTASTTAGALWVAAPAGTSTTTVQINGNANGEPGSATKGSCIQLWREGVAYKMYLAASSTPEDAVDAVFLRVTTGSCRD